MNNLQNFAKVSGLTEQQAYTFAVCVRYNMKNGMTLQQAVEHQMACIKAMVA